MTIDRMTLSALLQKWAEPIKTSPFGRASAVLTDAERGALRAQDGEARSRLFAE